MDHVWPRIQWSHWPKAWRRTAFEFVSNPTSMNARIAPTPVGVRKSKLKRLAFAASVVRAPLPAASLPATGIDDVTKRSSVPIASRLSTAVTRTCPPSLRAASVPGMRNEPGNSPTETTSSASGSFLTSVSSFLSRSSSSAEAAGCGVSRSMACSRSRLAFARASSFASRSSSARIVSSCFAIVASCSARRFLSVSISLAFRCASEEPKRGFLEGVSKRKISSKGSSGSRGRLRRGSLLRRRRRLRSFTRRNLFLLFLLLGLCAAGPRERRTQRRRRGAAVGERFTSPADRSRVSPFANGAYCGSSRGARRRCRGPRSASRTRRGP